jgi:hypothetical protein
MYRYSSNIFITTKIISNEEHIIIDDVDSKLFYLINFFRAIQARASLPATSSSLPSLSPLPPLLKVYQTVNLTYVEEE